MIPQINRKAQNLQIGDRIVRISGGVMTQMVISDISRPNIDNNCYEIKCDFKGHDGERIVEFKLYADEVILVESGKSTLITPTDTLKSKQQG